MMLVGGNAEQARWAKCLWCDERVLLYFDQVDGRYHFISHDWRTGERCANSHKIVFSSEMESLDYRVSD